MKYYNKKIKLFSTFILSCISILGLSQSPASQKFHDTKGNIEVTQAGQLQYTLPIDLPPGVKNIAPNISLVYGSGAGNGLAGYGWNISGITAISRVGKNLEQDGEKKGIKFDYSDYYSFKGQRLILKSGEYGKDGAEYVTEKYSNIKIKSVGALTGEIKGPEYWEVTFEDGSQALYGGFTSGNSDARTPIDYNIVRTKDINGNVITFNYSFENNVAVIMNIGWGANYTQQTSNFNRIEFTYKFRPIPETAYMEGIGFSQSRLLESVLVYTNGKQDKKYSISYKQDWQLTGYRYLDKITVLNSKNEEANPVTFTYEKSMDLPFNYGWEQTWSLRPKEGKDLVGDFDGDGNLDLLRYHSATSQKIPETGLYLYSNLYKGDKYNSIIPTFLGNMASLVDINDATTVNLKKDNLIRNRQGFVIKKRVNNPTTSKSDLELSFYSITESNQLNLDYKKVIPFSGYSLGPGSLGRNNSIVLGLKNVDFNGDGLSELVLRLLDERCWRDPNNFIECEYTNRYVVVDPDESIQTNQWYYTIPLYNNTNEEVFTDYRVGDFNGDGLIDLLKLDENKRPYLITFQKNLQGKYTSDMIPYSVNNQTLNGIWESGVVGDYNGDGLSDIMIPQSNDSSRWYFYASTGTGFAENIIDFERPQKDRTVYKDNYQNIKISNPKSFVAYDINNDGKAEFIRLSSYRNYTKDSFQDSNTDVRYHRGAISSFKVFSIFKENEQPIEGSSGSFGTYLYLNENNINNELAVNHMDFVGLPVDQWSGAMLRRLVLVSAVPAVGYVESIEQFIASHPYYDIAKEARIKSISQGGIVTDITYKQLDKKANPWLYDISQTESYPYVQINQSVGMYVVSGITQSTMSDKKLKQDFRYRGLTSNILGRGMIGFRKTARSSWYADGFESTKVWSGVEIDPTNDGIPVKEWTIRTNDDAKIFPADISENNTQLLSFKSTTYQIDKLLNGQLVTIVSDANKSKVVTAIVPKTNKGKDFLTSTIAESKMIYGEHYLPMQNISKINGGYSVKTSTYEYNNNPTGTGGDYYIGRLKSKTEVIQAYNDTKSGKEEYTYENSNLKTIKKWNTDNTGYLLDTYHYDMFGNVIQKVTSNSVDSQTQTEKSEYDPKARFVIKKTDNLGLDTHVTYNDWGQILTQTDPMGNVLTNTYDEWGKLTTSKTNLTGMISYIYDKDGNSNTIVTQNKPDGDRSTTFTNKLGQQYKVSAKGSGQGQFISKETQYDILGRKVKESEPYFEGQGASKWNMMEYDDAVFPAKVKVTAFTGKQSETIVSGLTTTITELNGNGRITSKTIDALGNVISSTDKGGIIQFSYNASGDQIQAKYAENIVTTKYDSWGQKSEFNDPSNGIYKYEYTGFGLPKKTISPKGTKEYIYNTLGQLISQKEFSTIDNGQTTNKTISFTYNEKGQLTNKSGTLKGQIFNSVLIYDPQGRLISSSENSNGKTYTEKDITFDNKGKVISFEKELLSRGFSTKVTIENRYNTWNGALYQIKDKNSGRILWELKEENAKGQVLKAQLGGTEVGNIYDANGFLQETKQSSSLQSPILNIQYTFNAIRNELSFRKTLGDIYLEESFDYDDNNRLINWTNPVTGIKPSASRNVYDIKGRITENDEVGMMKFENSAKIYQSTGMTLNTAGTQNYKGDLIQTVLYNENNDPVWIHGEKTRINFEYGLNSMRQRVDIQRLKSAGGATELRTNGEGIWDPNAPQWKLAFTKFYNEDGSFEVVKDQATGEEKHILYIEGSPYESNIIYLKDFGETTGSYKFLHKDYIGSILAISDEAGNKVEQRHYDAWGNLTHLKLGNASVTTDKAVINGTSLLIDRGYTGHEHFMEVGIIHMNGRLYDPLLRRFLNADENIQDPMNTQNYNKYGYVMNNPLMYNDPDGEFLLWAAGALLGGYLNGVAANGGNWNPGKWDWERTWSAVLGGAIGGAAVSGALGNIASNGGAIKNFLPGIVSGGLNSAFTGGNFLGGAIGGISYTGNLFDNRITSTGKEISYRSMRSSDAENGAFGNYLGSMHADPLSVVLSIYGLNPNAPANIYSLSIIASVFAPKDAWIAVGSTDTMNEWAKDYIKFSINKDGHLFDHRDLNAKPILGITNPVTGRIILAPILFNGKKTNYSLGEVVIHESKHFINWKNGVFQGNNPIMNDLDEISAYITAGQWTGIIDSGIKYYLNSITNYMLNFRR
ncbi:RHS repeat-associated core domain-containing protein [Chryseobacterium jejuense]|uniref:Cell wall-associated polypeptide CWBP200 n=1 Tax=Chryseobacterium jejuense TaxID=445960 RepID=A0A2X2X437_CHRJE|nr:RHS repeat-associated core domain-containing protein [Chryseobacterium jejuense]SDJ32093.1 RHS repeat-associated core domain-containing protein [Chryseobacterium jejuense]SQB45381.1 Cell wall-associated polypeptide CWBP200 [Chryseobacterium jejuense]